MTVLESAALPQKPYRPLYTLDAGLSLVGSLLLGLLAVWFVEFFSPKQPRDPAVVVQQGWAGLPLAHDAAGAPPVLAAERPLHLTGPDGAAPPVPRILTDAETASILGAASNEARLAITALLSGIAPEELIRLTWDSVEPGQEVLRIEGDEPRRLAIGGPLRSALATRPEAERAGPLLRNPAGGPAALSDLDNLVTYAAYDAALDRADEVTPQTLRHTYILFLLGQGIRLSDIGRIVGRIPREDLMAYARYGAPEMRLPLDQVDRVPPGLKGLG